MSAAAVAVQGSGWGWLGYDKESGRLRITACANQDPLQGTTGQLKQLSYRDNTICQSLPDLKLRNRGHFPSTLLRSHPPPWYRRVGARLLPAVQKRAAGLCEGYVECHQLGECERAPAVCQKVEANPPLTWISIK